jgi:ribosomal protein S18 acetylase RimI-like enzyme
VRSTTNNLAGLGLLGDDLAPGIVQVALLYVSRPYRRRGVADALMDEMEHLARDRGAHALYVSSVPSESAVGFYLARGFRPTEPLPEPLAKEPEDIHMLLPQAKLSPWKAQAHSAYPIYGRSPFPHGNICGRWRMPPFP